MFALKETIVPRPPIVSPVTFHIMDATLRWFPCSPACCAVVCAGYARCALVCALALLSTAALLSSQLHCVRSLLPQTEVTMHLGLAGKPGLCSMITAKYDDVSGRLYMIFPYCKGAFLLSLDLWLLAECVLLGC